MKFLQLFWFLFPAYALFAVDPDNGGGDGKEPTTPASGEDKTPVDGSKPAAITFSSQAELDALFKPRTEAAANKAKAELLATLGVEDEAALAKMVKDAETAKQAQMTELEKAQAEIAKAQDEAAKAKADAATIQAQAQEALMKAAVISAAGNFQDPTDAWLYVDRSKIAVNEDGGFDGVEDAVKAVSETKAYLLKSSDTAKPKGTPGRQPAAPPQPTKTGLQNAWDEAQPTIRF